MTPALARSTGRRSPGSTSPSAASRDRAGRGSRPLSTPSWLPVKRRTCAPRSPSSFAIHGPREARSKARLAFLVDAWGSQRFRKELEARLGRALPPGGRDARGPTTTDHIGIFQPAEPGPELCRAQEPVGRVSGDQLLDLARLAEALRSVAQLRFTPSQNVVIPCVPDALLGRADPGAAARELPYNPSEIRRGLVSCTGTDFCNLALIDTKTRALALAREFEQRLGRRAL